jgi:hypothetical protein
MTAKFGTQFQFHIGTHIRIVFPPVSTLTTLRMFQYARLTQAGSVQLPFQGPTTRRTQSSQPRVCTDFCVAALKRRHACADHRHLLQRNLAPSFAAHKFQNTYLSSELLRYLLRICPHWPMHQLAPSSKSASCSRLGKTHTLFLRAQTFTYCTMRRSRTQPSSIRSPQ